MLRMSSCAEGVKLLAISFENNLVLRTSQQSLEKRRCVFRDPWLHQLLLILELKVQFQHSKGPDWDRGPPVE